MNHGPLIFLAAFLALGGSWFGFVFAPQAQIGRLQQTNSVPGGVAYPVNRPGLAQEGREVYRANGCAVCHSQQVGQTATVYDVILTETGTNQAAILGALQKVVSGMSEAGAREMAGRLPATVLKGVSKDVAEKSANALINSGAKAQPAIVPVGPDIARGWGKRRTVAEDFLYDYPVQPGLQRIGPDLANVGVRLPDANWHLRHLYAPRSEVKDSIMPPHRFLFEARRIVRDRSVDALVLTKGFAPEPGWEIVPKPDAQALVAYLLSLRADTPLFAAPLTIAGAAVVSSTNSAPSTPPAK